MTEQEIRKIIDNILDRETEPLERPNSNEWRTLEDFFQTLFPPEFKIFIDLMAEYSFPGDVYNVTSRGKTNGNDTIMTIYNSEIQESGWPKHMIPFYGIGNGDYFSLNSYEYNKSAVYYRSHETGKFEKYCDTFSEWIQKLPDFLNG